MFCWLLFFSFFGVLELVKACNFFKKARHFTNLRVSYFKYLTLFGRAKIILMTQYDESDPWWWAAAQLYPPQGFRSEALGRGPEPTLSHKFCDYEPRHLTETFSPSTLNNFLSVPKYANFALSVWFCRIVMLSTQFMFLYVNLYGKCSISILSFLLGRW